ncbi:hypothetical protein ACK3TF_002937 [Chlorella vulgaris]
MVQNEAAAAAAMPDAPTHRQSQPLNAEQQHRHAAAAEGQGALSEQANAPLTMQHQQQQQQQAMGVQPGRRHALQHASLSVQQPMRRQWRWLWQLAGLDGRMKDSPSGQEQEQEPLVPVMEWDGVDWKLVTDPQLQLSDAGRQCGHAPHTEGQEALSRGGHTALSNSPQRNQLQETDQMFAWTTWWQYNFALSRCREAWCLQRQQPESQQWQQAAAAALDCGQGHSGQQQQPARQPFTRKQRRQWRYKKVLEREKAERQSAESLAAAAQSQAAQPAAEQPHAVQPAVAAQAQVGALKQPLRSVLVEAQQQQQPAVAGQPSRNQDHQQQQPVVAGQLSRNQAQQQQHPAVAGQLSRNQDQQQQHPAVAGQPSCGKTKRGRQARRRPKPPGGLSDEQAQVTLSVPTLLCCPGVEVQHHQPAAAAALDGGQALTPAQHHPPATAHEHVDDLLAPSNTQRTTPESSSHGGHSGACGKDLCEGTAGSSDGPVVLHTAEGRSGSGDEEMPDHQDVPGQSREPDQQPQEEAAAATLEGGQALPDQQQPPAHQPYTRNQKRRWIYKQKIREKAARQSAVQPVTAAGQAQAVQSVAQLPPAAARQAQAPAVAAERRLQAQQGCLGATTSEQNQQPGTEGPLPPSAG